MNKILILEQVEQQVNPLAEWSTHEDKSSLIAINQACNAEPFNSWVPRGASDGTRSSGAAVRVLHQNLSMDSHSDHSCLHLGSTETRGLQADLNSHVEVAMWAGLSSREKHKGSHLLEPRYALWVGITLLEPGLRGNDHEFV